MFRCANSKDQGINVYKLIYFFKNIH